MTDESFSKPRQPKLRSSCDGCGAAKLRCDRGQPECGRCLSHGLICVYGVSQKMGKPPKDRSRVVEASHASRSSGRYSGGHDRGRNHDYINGNDGLNLNATGTIDNFSHGFHVSVDALDHLQNNTYRSLFPDLTTLGLGDDFLYKMETVPISPLESPELERYPTPMVQTEASQFQAEDSRSSGSALMPPTGSKSHDCFREAYDILGSLSFHSLDNARPVSQSSSGSIPKIASNSDPIPLDHVLHLNREASERLSCLLSCSCAKSPHVALLCASIISRILLLYQQAADGTQISSQSSTTMALDAASQQISLAGPSLSNGSISRGGSLKWSSKAASIFSTGGTEVTPTLTQSTKLTVAPTKMAIGTFSVDDLRIQTALKTQLISGEMRRAGCLIDHVFLYGSDGQCSPEEYDLGGISSLYQNLHSWLRGEHSRMVNMMRSKLRDLNT